MSLLFDRFTKVAEKYASKAALIFKDERISYADLLERINTKANALQSCIPYVGLNNPEQIVTLLACAKVNAVFLPINYRLAEAEITSIKQDALMGTSFVQGGCLLVYTSGTTGTPKGALHTQAGLLANARASWAAHEMTTDDMVLSTLPLFHVGGLCIQTLPALLLGATVLLHERFDADAWLGAVQSHRPTLSLVVPATMKAIQSAPGWTSTDLTSLRGVMAGSSTIPRHLIEAFHARGIPVGQIYGTTETGPVSAVLPFGKAISHVGLAGWPHDDCAIELHNKNKQGIGEVCIQANNLMAGYWNANNGGRVRERSESDLTPIGLDSNNFFNTGDLGRFQADGCLEIVGRSKDMLISGGENIYPAEIENALLAHPDVEECAVIGELDNQWGEIPVAYLVWKNRLEPLSDKILQEFLSAKIAKFKLPKRYVTIAVLPKSALGKVLKTELRLSSR